MKTITTLTVISIFLSFGLFAQPWVQNDAIFNPSGIPSLPFSQPRLADLDNDGDYDLIIGSIDEHPLYFENTGNNATPTFEPGPDYFSMVEYLDAEMGVCNDIDGDGDLDFITGGFTGLNLYLNIGNPEIPEFEKVTGFFDGLSVGQNPIPDFADIDTDGDPDMIVGFSESGIVKIYINTGTNEVAEFIELNSYEVGDVGLYAYPVFCDVDMDNDQDLVVGRDGHNFTFYKNTGDANNPVWEIDETYFEGLAGETYWNSPTLADITADGKPDLIFGTASGPLNYFTQTGTPGNPEWQINTALFGGVMDVGGASNPCFFDYDGDGDLDLFTGSQLGDIKYYQNTGTASGPAWEENSGSFTSLKHSIYSAVAMGDVNNDGLADAVVGDLSGNLFYHRNTGLGFEFESSAFQGVALGGWSSPCLVDFDNDGDLDIIAGSENGYLHYIENQGDAQEPDWNEISGYFSGIDVGSNCVPAIVDIDYDEDWDIVCGTLFGNVYCFINESGEWVQNPEILDGISGEQNTTPAFGDLDNDGDPDLTLGQYSGVFNYFRNQYLVTGLADHQNIPDAMSAKLFPNPFTDEISIEFELKTSCDIKIELLNLSGNKIMEINEGILQPGLQIQKLETGVLPSGIYFIQIKTPDGSTLERVIKI